MWGLLTATMLALAAWGYEVAVGLPRYVDGKWVQRHSSRYGLIWPWPIPGRLAEVYYFYTNERGEEVRHGELRQYHGNGMLQTVSQYRHGKHHGISSDWNDKGQKTGDLIFRQGELIGWADYRDGELVFHTEGLYDENGTPIATKRFEGGRWFLRFYSGRKATLQIDPKTGEVSRLD